MVHTPRTPRRCSATCAKSAKTFSGTPGFKGRHFSAKTIARALDDHISGKSLGAVARGLKTHDGITVSRTTVYRWSNEYSTLLYRFSRSLRPILGPKWHCDEIFHKMLGLDRWLFAVMDERTYCLATYLTPNRDTNHCPCLKRRVEWQAPIRGYS